MPSVNFPKLEVVKKVILERRGKEGLKEWLNTEWGSHWYVGLSNLMEKCGTDREAELLLHSLFFLGDLQDKRGEARYVRERLFIGELSWK